MRLLTTLLLAAAFLLVVPSHAQEATGTISGIVKDATSKVPLIEAVITLSAPELNGKRLAITDSSGIYKVASLPAGVYTLMFEMEGYQKLTKENIQVSNGVPVELNLELVREKPAGKPLQAADPTTNFRVKAKLFQRSVYIR